MKHPILLTAVVVFAAGALLWSGFSLGVSTVLNRPSLLPPVYLENVSTTTIEADFGTFWQAWNSIDKIYLKSTSTSKEDRVYGAISGLVDSLGDPYSEFFPPEDGKKFREDIQGDFGGIGAQIGTKEGRIIIIAPLKDSPAMQAGLKAGDYILSVNATSTAGLGVDRAVQIIRGPIDSKVKLLVLREGWDEPKEYEIVRAKIVAPTLDFSMKEGGVAYVQLYSFNGNTERLFRDAMIQAFGSGMRGLVLDLRNNPGGYLDVAVNLAGWFVPRGKIVLSEETKRGVEEVFRASGNEVLLETPVVILINGGSASASEILAGALQDIRGAKLIGETTFGKGTVQQLEEFADGSSIKLTIAHWVLPSGKILEGKGIGPDFSVAGKSEDEKEPEDLQLKKAIEVLMGEIK
ncbi:MAG: S41 family peptidase [Patescibacteria group bacterium]